MLFGFQIKAGYNEKKYPRTIDYLILYDYFVNDRWNNKVGKLDIVFHTTCYSIEYKTQLNKQIIEYTS